MDGIVTVNAPEAPERGSVLPDTNIFADRNRDPAKVAILTCNGPKRWSESGAQPKKLNPKSGCFDH